MVAQSGSECHTITTTARQYQEVCRCICHRLGLRCRTLQSKYVWLLSVECSYRYRYDVKDSVVHYEPRRNRLYDWVKAIKLRKYYSEQRNRGFKEVEYA